RAIPNLVVIRPADATETVEACRLAILSQSSPVALVLTRQKVPVIDRATYAPANGLRLGGYVLAEARGAKPAIVLLASGSEVELALGAYERLTAEGIAARVVSVPSMELFARQPQEYRDAVLPPTVAARLAVEAVSPPPAPTSRTPIPPHHRSRLPRSRGARVGRAAPGPPPPAGRAREDSAAAPAASGRRGSRPAPSRYPGWRRARRARSRPDRRP